MPRNVLLKTVWEQSVEWDKSKPRPLPMGVFNFFKRHWSDDNGVIYRLQDLDGLIKGQPNNRQPDGTKYPVHILDHAIFDVEPVDFSTDHFKVTATAKVILHSFPRKGTDNTEFINISLLVNGDTLCIRTENDQW